MVSGTRFGETLATVYIFGPLPQNLPSLQSRKLPANLERTSKKAPYMKDFFTKLVRSKYSLIFLVLFIALLYFLQEKAIVPLVMKVVKSDLFFEPEKEEEQLGRIEKKTQRIGFALAQCKDAVKEEGELPDSVEFSDDKFEAWALGNRHYIIRSSVRVIDPEKGQTEKLFACKIRMTGDDETDPKSWSILGVDFTQAEGG
jgi:hypothetical protein